MNGKWRGLFQAALLMAVVALSLPVFASGTPELVLTSGGSSTGVIMGSGNNVSFTGSLNGWSIFLEFSASNSPHLTPNFGLDLDSILLVCKKKPCEDDPLTVTATDIGFTDAPPALFSSYDAISQTTSGTNVPSVTQTSWWGASTYFAETNQIGSAATVTGAPVVNQTVTTGGSGPTAPYSLTVQDVFSANGSTTGPPADTQFNGTGDIGGAPEPRTMLLFGSGLLAMASFIRRFRRA